MWTPCPCCAASPFFFPEIPLAETDTFAFQERLWVTAAQGVTAPIMGEAEKASEAAKVVAPTGFIPTTLLVEHYTVVMATLLHDTHGVPKELFEMIEVLEQNKRHINAKAGEIKFTS